MTHTLAGLVEGEIPQQLLPEELRTLYRREGEGARRKAARQGLWLAVGVYLLFAINDLLLIPDVAAYTAATRLAIGATVLVILEIQLRANVRTDWLDVTCAAALVSGFVGWL